MNWGEKDQGRLVWLENVLTRAVVFFSGVWLEKLAGQRQPQASDSTTYFLALLLSSLSRHIAPSPLSPSPALSLKKLRQHSRSILTNI